MRTDRLLLGIAITVFLAAYTFVAFSFFTSHEGELQLVYLALLGAPVAAAVVLMPQAAVLALAALVYSIDWLSEFWAAVPREATWLIDILIWILIARMVLFMPVRREPMPRVEKFIFLALGFAILTAVLNGLSQTTTLIGIRVGFRYLLLFVAVYHLAVSRRWVRGFVGYLFVIGLIQTPVIIAQFRTFGWSDPDVLCGTFGQSQTPGIALFLLVLVTFLVARMIEQRRLRQFDLLLIAFMAISPVLGEAKLFFLALPVLMGFLIRAEFVRRPAVSFGLMLSGVLLIISADYAVRVTGGWMSGRNPLTYVTRLVEVFKSELEEPQIEYFERSYVVASGVRLALSSPRNFALGNGPGSVTRSYVSHEHSPRAAYYARWGISSASPSIPWLLTEYGYVGTALFLYILWLIYRRGRVLRASGDRELRIYGRVLEAMTFLYVLWLFYVNTWQSDSMNFVYWPLAGMFVYHSYREEERRKREEAEQRRHALRAPEAQPNALSA